MTNFVVTVSKDTANGDVSRDDLSLREAIGLANSHPRADQITFADNVHRVTLRDALPTISDDLRLVGGGDVVLDANVGRSDEQQRRALDIRGDDLNATIDGLTITGGGHSGGGGGIRSGRDVDLRVVDCEIVGNRVEYSYGQSRSDGGGILAQGDLTLLGSRVADNGASADGGGIAVLGKAVVRGSTIEENDAYGIGGGIAAFGKAIVRGSTIEGNGTYGDGGGIAVNGRAIVRGSTIEGNGAVSGGGIAFSGAAIVRGSTIERNGAYGSAGGILANDGLRITNSDVLNNEANAGTHYDHSAGGGMSVGGDLTVVRSRVDGNLGGPGGGIAAFGTATILHSKIVGNEGYSGGGILATGDIHVWRSRIAENFAAAEFEDVRGGGISGEQDVTLSRVQILGNEVRGFGYSASGGGVSARGSVEANNTVIAGNRAAGSLAFGGGIYADTVETNRSDISRNAAEGVSTFGEMVRSSGGGIFADVVELEGSEVSRNVVRSQYGELGGYGGGISAKKVTISQSAITENLVEGRSNLQGGGVFARRVDAFSSTIAWNEVRDLDADIAGMVGGGGLWISRRGLLEAVTLSGNEVAGSGLGGAVMTPDGLLRMNSSLVVGNAAADGDDEISGTLVQLMSLVGGDGRQVFAAAEQVAPGIFGGVLAGNGGTTPTILLSVDPANPAIGTGNPELEGTLDQRGVTRDADPDLGAIEARTLTMAAERRAVHHSSPFGLTSEGDWFVVGAWPQDRQRGEYLARSGDLRVAGGVADPEPDFLFF